MESTLIFLLGDFPASEFCVPTFRNTLSVLVGGVNKKNNLDQTARVFLQVKVRRKEACLFWKGERACPSGGLRHKWRPVARQVCTGETAVCRGGEVESWDDSEMTVVFQEAVSLL